VFLGLAVVIYTTIDQFYISSIGGQSSLLFGVFTLNLNCAWNAKSLFSLTANCQLLIIIRGLTLIRLGNKRENLKKLLIPAPDPVQKGFNTPADSSCAACVIIDEN
jgi:hypothetical protein